MAVRFLGTYDLPIRSRAYAIVAVSLLALSHASCEHEEDPGSPTAPSAPSVVSVTVTLVPRAGRKNRPAQDQLVRIGGLLINQELNLHIDPTLVCPQTPHRGHPGQIGVEPLGHFPPESM